jgi:CHAT domain-containing protein
VASGLASLGEIYQLKGDATAAETLYRQALEIRRERFGERTFIYADTLYHLAAVLAAKKGPSGAPLAGQAMQTARTLLDRAAAVQSERQQLAMLEKVRKFLDGFMTVTAAAKTPADQVYAEVLAWKGAVLTRQRSLRGLRRDQTPEVAKLFEALTTASRRLAALSLAAYDAKTQAARLKEMENLSEEVERLERALSQVSEDFRRQLAQRRVTADDLRNALPRDTVLVDFLEYEHISPPAKGQTKEQKERRLAAFVIQSGMPALRLDLGPVEPIAAAIDSWRKHFGLKTGTGAAALRRRIWEPLAAAVKGSTRVLLSPDGALARFPLAALPGQEPGSYLLEEVAIGVVPVPQLLPELLRKPATVAKASLLLVGDVTFDAEPGTSTAVAMSRSAPRASPERALSAWRPLPGTRNEIVAIKDTFMRRFRKEASVLELREDEPTEGEVRKQAPRHRYLHFATHGFFAPAALRSALAASKPERCGCSLFGRQDVAGFHPGLLSGLVLAGANKEATPDQDDGILTALEVAQLDLSGVELATLSACETGLGETAGGEGLLGLQRAFQVAGARSVVATLWQVRDDAARSLMVDFYENLWRKKMPKLEALRAAQLTMLRQGINRGLEMVRDQPPDAARRLPPYYWAAFVLSGDPN